jgi:hypothetical protein
MAYRHDEGSRRNGASGSELALAQGLGWFSVGLGLAEVLAPQSVARFLGMDEHAGLIRFYGIREITAGVGILSQDDPTPWLWGRIAGDALDLATLAIGLNGDNPRKGNVTMALAAVAGVTALDVICAQALSASREPPEPPLWDYSDRSGLPRSPLAMRGAARDFEVPEDMRMPAAMRPYTGA